MKKLLTLLCSAVLGIALAMAGPQQARKIGSSYTPTGLRAAKVQPRTASQARSLLQQTRKAPQLAFSSGRLRVAQNKAFAPRFSMKKHNALFAGAASELNLPDLAGNVLFADTWTNESHPGAGLNRLPKSATGDFELITDSVSNGYGGVLVDNVYYYGNYYDFFGTTYVFAYGVDITTGEEVYNASSGSLTAYPVAQVYDENDQKIYAVCYNETGDGLIFGTMEYTAEGPVTTVIGDLSAEVCALTLDANGQFYAITRNMAQQGEQYICVSSTLNKLNRNTAELTPIGTTGQLPYYASGAVIDKTTGRMFWTLAPLDETGYLCEVNLTTGVATNILDFKNNEEVGGLIILPPAAEQKAPAAVSNLTINFPQGATTGSVDFTAPTTLYDGTPATGTLTYNVAVDGTVKKTGTCSAGEAVSVPMTFLMMEEGAHSFSVWTSNATGDSPKTTQDAYIGVDQPKAPQNVQISYADGKITITWDPVTEGIGGGYIDVSQITYAVTRKLPTFYPVEYSTTALTATDQITFPEDYTQYQYMVTATAAAGTPTSPAGMSNVISLGNIKPPYSQNFDSATALEGFTVIDGNDDGITWQLDEGTASLKWSKDEAADDWLVTPGLKLEANKVYTVSFRAYGSNAFFTEQVEAMYGQQPTAAALTNTLVASTAIEVGKDNALTLTATIRPAATGVFYIGIHGISQPDQYKLFIDDLTVSEGVSDGAPAAPALEMIPDPAGTTMLTGKVTAPSKAINGSALSSLTKIEIYRDEALLKTISPVAPGTEYTFTDDPGEVGNYEYSAAAFNADGKGEVIATTAFAGTDLPAAPASVTAVEAATPGFVTISWDAVTQDQNGKPLNPDLVTYTIMDPSTYEVYVENISGTSVTIQVLDDATDQDFFQFGLLAATSRGYSKGVVTDIVCLGTPYNGIHESFADGGMTYSFAADNSGGASVGLGDDSLDSEVRAQDGDNGFVYFSGQYGGVAARLISAKINLAEMTNPALTFWVFMLNTEINRDDENTLTVFANEVGGKESELKKFVIGQLPHHGWNRIEVPLDAFAGKTIQFALQADIITYGTTIVDNVRVGNRVDNDLSISAITAPLIVKAGNDYTVDVTLVNQGSNAATGHTLRLFADGSEVAVHQGEEIAAGGNKVVTFPMTMQEIREEPVNFHAVVELTGDEDPANNTSATITVKSQTSSLPVPRELTATLSPEGGAALTWSEPDLTGPAVDIVNESFETAEDFAHEYGEWTFLDRDGYPAGGFQGTDIPGINPGEKPSGFFVFNSDSRTYPQFNSTFAAHSGSKFLASLYSEGMTVDDWAISPLLSGNKQIITFYARSYSGDYPEAIEVYASTKSANPADFVLCYQDNSVSSSWYQVEIELAPGTKYFAVRSCATDAFMLMVDDFSYETAVGTLELQGYNVFRNGVKITDTPVEDCSYTDLKGPNEENAYRVNAVYSAGVSRGSNEVKLVTSGIDLVSGADVSISTGAGFIAIDGAEGAAVSVVAVDGRTLYAAPGADHMQIPATPGLYVVTAGTVTAKVIVL